MIQAIRPTLQVFILALVVLCGEPLAQAQKKVVIFNFGGPGGARARRGVIRAMAQQVTFVRVDDFLAEGDMAGVNPIRGKGLVTTCTRMKVDAVIKGKVRRRGKRYKVTVSVVNGGTGERLGRRAATVRGSRKVIRAGRAIGKQLLPLLEDAAHLSIKPVAPVKPKPAPVFKPRPRKVKKKKKSALTLDGLFDLSVSMGIAMRNYHLEGADPALDRKYEGGVYPEFNLRLDLFPLAPFMRNFARNIGLSVGYTRHLTVSTTMTTQAQGEVEVDTGSQELLLDLMVRWPIFDKPTSPVILGHAGWGMRHFTLGPNHILPSFKYNFVRFGLGGRIPLTTPLIALEAGFDLRPLLAVGQEAIDAFGQKEGGFSWSLRAGISGRTSLGLFYGLMFEYLRFSTDFAGRWDIDPKITPSPLVRKDPTGGSDGFIRFLLTVGYGM